MHWNNPPFIKLSEEATGGVLQENVFLEILQNSQENTCTRVSFLIKLQANFIKKETLAQVFPCEFCEISQSTFFAEHLLATASELCKFHSKIMKKYHLFGITDAFYYSLFYKDCIWDDTGPTSTFNYSIWRHMIYPRRCL